jgi:hypothetical protein
MPDKSHLWLSREELYELVWSKPMTKIAADYKISDRAMAKICKRKQVPVPERGYWAKKSSGKTVRQPPLPAFITKPVIKKAIIEPTEKPKIKPTKIISSYEKEAREKLKDFKHIFSDLIYYVMRVDSWEWDYSFGLNPNFNPLKNDKSRWSIHEEIYRECGHLIFKGVFLRPKLLNGQQVRACFVPSSRINAPEREKASHRYTEWMPKSVGSLQGGKDSMLAVFSIPDEVLGRVLQVATANKVRFFNFSGQKTRYGHASIVGYSLREEFGDDDE